MKTILCFGDSITWGYHPKTAERHPFQDRWTGVLKETLGNEYDIIEAGVNGRTTAFDDPVQPNRNGSLALPIELLTHAPIDLVIIMLGVNDVKIYNHGCARQASAGCSLLIRQVRSSMAGPGGGTPKILLMSPPPLNNPKGYLDTLFPAKSIAASRELAQHYRTLAEYLHVDFLDVAPLVTVSPEDGCHLEASENHKLGKAVAKEVTRII